jgi:hypothetical protein
MALDDSPFEMAFGFTDKITVVLELQEETTTLHLLSSAL